MTERITIMSSDTREQKIEKAQKVRAEFDAAFPELAKLRRDCIALEMCKDNFSSVVRVHTQNIDYGLS